MLIANLPSPLDRLKSDFFSGIEVWIKRDDLLHVGLSGNKFRKLMHALQNSDSNAKGPARVVSMGGAWSNHLHALAHAAALLGLRSTALIRNTTSDALTPTLKDCADLGMHLQFVDRTVYRSLRYDADRWRSLVADPEGALWLPEGGRCEAALSGVAAIVEELPFIPDAMVVACGTGTTLAGLVLGMRGRGRVIGIACAKRATYLERDVGELLAASDARQLRNFEIVHGHEFGDFGRAPPELIEFCRTMRQTFGLTLEPVYTGKMMYGLTQLCRSGKFSQNEKVVAVHTGGLQGLRGFSALELGI
jgi:1-aminocyclopropane-1-carboxylate deaminase